MLSYRNLQKVLEERISEVQRREGTRSLVCTSLGFSTWRALAERQEGPKTPVGEEAPLGFIWGSFSVVTSNVGSASLYLPGFGPPRQRPRGAAAELLF